MPNLMLTNYCNYKCSYCFGKDIMFPKNPRQMMSRETRNSSSINCTALSSTSWAENRPYIRISTIS